MSDRCSDKGERSQIDADLCHLEFTLKYWQVSHGDVSSFLAILISTVAAALYES